MGREEMMGGGSSRDRQAGTQARRYAGTQAQ